MTKFADRQRCANFSGGPGALAPSVLEEAAAAVAMFEDTGDSILGLSHRSPRFLEIVKEAESLILSLLGSPKGYRVLFLQGGGTLQFSMVPMHLLRGSSLTAEYLVSGYWSAKAVAEARWEGSVREVWSGAADGFHRTPAASEFTLSPDAAYLHYVSNETVEGIRYPYIPGVPGVPLICDMSSDFLSRPLDINRYDLVYAHTQKNLGPAGVTAVLVRDWILERGEDLPPFFRYKSHADNDSIFNTPPVFAIYVTMLVARWLTNEVGGLERIAVINAEKARRLYQFIDDREGLFVPHAADRSCRSLMNVTATLRNRELEPELVAAAARAGIVGIGGHRSLGGLRFSLYNAVTVEAVDRLCDFLEDFFHGRRG